MSEKREHVAIVNREGDKVRSGMFKEVYKDNDRTRDRYKIMRVNGETTDWLAENCTAIDLVTSQPLTLAQLKKKD